ncbi:unnamed protein product [Rotaria sp. Silwood2]|nr:unnamed protein product [Rotaria sp. Silwood2]
MQAVQSINDSRYRLQWIDILSKVKEIKLSLEQFIQGYLQYQKAFMQFPFDTSVLMYLIQRMHSSKKVKESPFIFFLQLSQSLKVDDNVFFEQFQWIFSNGIKNQWYQMKDISELFTWLRSQDQLFGQYFSHYAFNVNIDDLWNMFLQLCRIKAINNVNQKHVMAILNEKIPLTSVDTFHRYTKLAKTYLVETEPESRSFFIELFEKIFDAYIIKRIDYSQYLYRFSRTNYKDLLQVGLEMSLTNRLERPSCLFLFRKILCEIESYHKTNAQKLMALFENLKNFDEKLCQKYAAEKIIDDEWLKDFLIINLQIWLKLDQETYKYLCENHQNNPWAIYIWSRILHLSLSNMLNNNHADILFKINDWMKKVKHHIYNPTDIFTIILVNKLFELVLIKYSKSILLLPNIDIIMNFIISMRENTSRRIDVQQINNFISNGLENVYEVFHLKSKCSLYRDLSTDSIIRCFLPLIDLHLILGSVDPQQYKFPLTNANIDGIVALPKPKDIDITNIESNEEFFARFIRQINEWFDWFDRFIDIFQHIIDWLKNHNVNCSSQLSMDLLNIRYDFKITFVEMRLIIDRVLKILQPFKDLRRLCHLFNCLISFQILNPGTLNTQDNTLKFLTELKRFQPNNTFMVQANATYEHIISISDRQQIQWSLASENHPCHITVKYRIHGKNNQYEILYQKENVPIHKNVLHGQFESQRNGQLIITIDNNNNNNDSSRTIWYRIKSISLSTCYLFHGIFNIHYDKCYQQNPQIISEDDFSKLLDQVFEFINKLLNGDVTLRAMEELRTIFYDKNINIREEVKKLYTNRTNEQNNDQVNIPNIDSNEKEIEQVCEWLQIYQYYSHLNIIMKCIEKFDILPLKDEEETIGHLRCLSGNENCSLRDITQAYRILQDCFQNLTHQHLQLIKTAVECSNVIEMMRKSELYSTHGRRRFQELRDNLTTQFQLQELNNMILNSWIITYTLI